VYKLVALNVNKCYSAIGNCSGGHSNGVRILMMSRTMNGTRHNNNILLLHLTHCKVMQYVLSNLNITKYCEEGRGSITLSIL
jgi:hypothetical protein